MVFQEEADYKIAKSNFNNKIKESSKDFWQKNKGFKHLIFFLLVSCIIFNFGALTITDTLLTKKAVKSLKEQGLELSDVLHEANPGASAIHDFKSVDDMDISNEQKIQQKSKDLKLIGSLFKQSLIWAVIYLLLIFKMNRTYTTASMYFLLFMLLMYFCITGWDCFHDLGILLGRNG